MYRKVEICGVHTADLKLFSAAETDALLRRVADGDTAARETLICGNLRLVLSVIQRFSRRAAIGDDLFQVGCIGLMKAIDHFDLSQNVRFSTYAVPMIIGEVRRYLRDNNMIRVSRSVRDLAYQALRIKEKLSGTLSRDPTVEEITEELNRTFALELRDATTSPRVSASKVSAALDAVLEPMSLFEPIYSEGGDSVSLMDQLCDTQNTTEHLMENIALKEALSRLSEREKRIVDLRYFAGKTQVEVAKEIGISQAQVSRLEKSALARVRTEL